ncbi:MAG: 6-phosphogluconolactonase [Nitrospirota bacterium]
MLIKGFMITMPEIRIFTNMEEIANYIVGKWAEISRSEIENKGDFSVALSGGRTPEAIYMKLSEEKGFPWGKTHVFMVDERFLPYESDENNFHMINRTLLRHISISPKNVHPIMTSVMSPETAAERYERDIITYFKTSGTGLPRFDLVLLGIGQDGHTASLFTGTPALKEERSFAVPVRPPEPSQVERITLTLPVINNARNICFIAAGHDKAKIIKEIVEEKESMLPAAMVRPRDGKLVFLLDESAGSLISEKIILT